MRFFVDLPHTVRDWRMTRLHWICWWSGLRLFPAIALCFWMDEVLMVGWQSDATSIIFAFVWYPCTTWFSFLVSQSPDWISYGESSPWGFYLRAVVTVWMGAHVWRYDCCLFRQTNLSFVLLEVVFCGTGWGIIRCLTAQFLCFSESEPRCHSSRWFWFPRRDVGFHPREGAGFWY